MRILLIVPFLLIIFSGCYNDKYAKLYPSPIDTTSSTTCDTSGIIKYSTDIKPIVQANCYSPGNGCHDAAGSGTSGYNYEIFSVFQSNAQNGWVVSDINFAPTRGHNNMPKNGTKLSDCDINKITRWVNEGALNN